MKFDWDNWNDGGKLIFVNACLAVLSMFMNWAEIGFAARTGMQTGAVLYLGFWIYPVVMLLKNKPINLVWGLLCAALSFALASINIIDMTSKELFGETIDVTGIGAWVFLVASFFLGVGIFRYVRLADRRESEAKVSEGAECPDHLLHIIKEQGNELKSSINKQKDKLKSKQNRSLLIKTAVAISIPIGGYVLLGVWFSKLNYDYCVEEIEYGDEYPFCAIHIKDSDRYLSCVQSIDVNRKYFMKVDASWLRTGRTNGGGYRIPFTAINDTGTKLSKVAVCDKLGRLLEIKY